jgi:hypothetical protein
MNQGMPGYRSAVCHKAYEENKRKQKALMALPFAVFFVEAKSDEQEASRDAGSEVFRWTAEILLWIVRRNNDGGR